MHTPHAQSLRTQSLHTHGAHALHPAGRPDRLWTGFASGAQPRQVLRVELPVHSPSSLPPFLFVTLFLTVPVLHWSYLFVKEQMEDRVSGTQKAVTMSQRGFAKHTRGHQPQRGPRIRLPGRQERRSI